MSARFPGERVARVVIGLSDGRGLDSGCPRGPGDPEDPLSDEQLAAKFESLAGPVLGAERTARIRELVAASALASRPRPLLDALLDGAD